jgi:hypothetical protein
VNEFISDLQRMPEVQQIPTELFPGWINTADDLVYWLRLLSEEIQRRDASDEEIPDIMFALRAVPETALRDCVVTGITELRPSWKALAPAPVPGGAHSLVRIRRPTTTGRRSSLRETIARWEAPIDYRRLGRRRPTWQTT